VKPSQDFVANRTEDRSTVNPEAKNNRIVGNETTTKLHPRENNENQVGYANRDQPILAKHPTPTKQKAKSAGIDVEIFEGGYSYSNG
jgi:hypothetical protein